MTPAASLSIENLWRDAIVAAIPDARLTIPEWADTYRVVSQGPEIGTKWKTTRVPFLREILDCATDRRVHEIVLWSSSRVGKTEGVLNNIVGFFMHIDPCPIMMVQPTLDMAEKYSRDRLTSLIRETPVLRDLVEDPRTRDSGNTLLHKTFRGGHISIVGANSPVGLASEDIRVLLLDEVDRFPVTAGAEGDPVALARVRTRNYAATLDALVVMTSSPTIEGQSRIARAYQASDRRKLFVQCPGCDAWQEPLWANIKWSDIGLEPSEAVYVCPECGVMIADDEKEDLISRYSWHAGAEFNGIAGFKLPGTVSPWITWGEMALEVTRAAHEHSLEQKQVFVNTTLGELWQPWEEIDKEDLEFRKEEYRAEVPADVVLLTFAVDVQIDRIEVEVAGWGIGDERWSIDYQIFRGDPARLEVEGEVTVWDELERYLERDWRHELGVTMRVRCGCIDSGGACTDAVYKFAKRAARRRKQYWAVKGSSVPGRPIAPRKPTRVGRENIPLRTIGTEVAKDRIAASLKSGWSEDGREWIGGPGSYHFPSHYTEDYFDQLTSERAVATYHRGYPVKRWELKPGARNEAWDDLVYNLAAKEILKPNLKNYRELLLERVEQRSGPPATAGGDDGQDQDDADRSGTRRREAFRLPRRRTGFVRNW